MTYIFFIIVFSINVIIPNVSDDYSWHSCILLFQLNIMTYPIFIMFLADTTIISKPVIKLQFYDDIRTTVVNGSKDIAKSSFLWGLLLCIPFIIYILIYKNILYQIDFISVAIITSSLILLVHLLMLSTIMILYYKKLYWILICGLGVIFTSFLAYINHTELNLLYLSIPIIILVYLLGVLLIKKAK